MAKTKSTKSKSSFDFKKMLLAKGEYILLGVAGLFLLIMLFSGFSSWSDAKDPTSKIKELDDGANRVNQGIKSTTISPQDEKETEPPEWVKKNIKYETVSVNEFPISGVSFDIIGKPGTKKDNPRVIEIGNLKYQWDLIRAPMLGYDIVGSGDTAKIAVFVDKVVGSFDKQKLEKLAPRLDRSNKRAEDAYRRMMGQFQGPGGGFAPPGVRPGPGFAPPPAFGGAGALQTGVFDSKTQRTEKTIKYIPLGELDQSIRNGNLPATTVIPLRMIVIHAEIPWKKQLEEVKRACRLKTLDDARKLVLETGGYDGYNVQRRETQVSADGKERVIQDWTNYKYEDPYIEKIASRSLADNFEDGYMSYFIPYDMYMALPLPQLVAELGAYPKIRLEGIDKTIKQLEAASIKPAEKSSLYLKLVGNKDDRSDLYRPHTGADRGASDLPGWKGKLSDFEAPKRPMVGGTAVAPKAADLAAATAPPIQIENLLLRFIDADVKPGHTYQYRIQLKMKNPNFGKIKEVANPRDAQTENLESLWTEIVEPIDVPPEDFLYAGDVAAYRKKIDEDLKDQRELRTMLQVKDNQTVIEMCRWMDQVQLAGKSGQGEPVGTWVVADMPVGRGELIGRKQYVKLPLWSSTAKDFVLREIPDSIPFVTTKPKGWLVNFSTPALLVDFEGGRVITKGSGNKVEREDVATEMLIVRPDGKLMVKNSLIDQSDAEDNTEHKKIVEKWENWLKDVESRKAADTKKEFERGKE